MRTKLFGGAILVSSLFTGVAIADPIIYVGDSGGRLGRVDGAAGTATLIGSFGSGLVMTDIAFDPSGQLWGITFSDLYRINHTTAAATHVGSFSGPTGLNSLTFSAGGTLYAAGISGNANLYTLDTSTGAATAVGPLGGTIDSSGDLAFHNGVLYLTDANSPFDNLVSVNTVTGAATMIGSMGVAAEYGIVHASDGKLYGVAGTKTYTVNTTTGLATFVSDFSGDGLSDAFGAAILTEASFPLPLPGAAAAGAALFGGIGLQRSRRGGADKFVRLSANELQT